MHEKHVWVTRVRMPYITQRTDALHEKRGLTALHQKTKRGLGDAKQASKNNAQTWIVVQR